MRSEQLCESKVCGIELIAVFVLETIYLSAITIKIARGSSSLNLPIQTKGKRVRFTYECTPFAITLKYLFSNILVGYL